MEPRPGWTIGYNIVSAESDKWVGTGWEFFDTEDEALACYRRHLLAGNTPFKRPYYPSQDDQHLGAVHRMPTGPKPAAAPK